MGWHQALAVCYFYAKEAEATARQEPACSEPMERVMVGCASVGGTGVDLHLQVSSIGTATELYCCCCC